MAALSRGCKPRIGFDLDVVDGNDGGPKRCQGDGKYRTLELTKNPLQAAIAKQKQN